MYVVYKNVVAAGSPYSWSVKNFPKSDKEPAFVTRIEISETTPNGWGRFTKCVVWLNDGTNSIQMLAGGVLNDGHFVWSGKQPMNDPYFLVLALFYTYATDNISMTVEVRDKAYLC